MAVKRVDELGYYSLGAKDLAEKCGLTMPRVVAVVDHLRLREDTKCYKEIRIGKAIFKRYSPQAIHEVKTCVKDTSIDEIWKQARARKK